MHPDSPMTTTFLPDGHLAAERLAALADECPTAAESHHLAACARCAEEVSAHRALLDLVRGERDRMGQPLTTWATLAPALERADLIDADLSGTPATHRRHSPSRSQRRWRQAAAAVALVGSGVAAGRLSTALPGTSAASVNAAAPQPAVGIHRDSNAPTMRLVSDTTAIQSRDQAYDALRDAEARYRHAVAYLMESDSGSLNETPDAYRTRLAALDQVEHTIKAALVEAQDDPVLNQWYISTVGARQATLRQLGRAVPVDEKRHRY